MNTKMRFLRTFVLEVQSFFDRSDYFVGQTGRELVNELENDWKDISRAFQSYEENSKLCLREIFMKRAMSIPYDDSRKQMGKEFCNVLKEIVGPLSEVLEN